MSSREEEYRKALACAITNLYGDGFDSLRPMSSQSCHQLAQFLELIYHGKTCEEARLEMEVGR
jgi:hypothetical protein